jgi:hypothetical protein
LKYGFDDTIKKYIDVIKGWVWALKKN